MKKLKLCLIEFSYMTKRCLELDSWIIFMDILIVKVQNTLPKIQFIQYIKQRVRISTIKATSET